MTQLASCHPPTLSSLSLSVQAAKVPLNEYEFPTNKLANVQSQLEKLVEKNYYLHQSAKDAYRSYLLSYNSHQLKNIFNVHALDLASVGKSFGFVTPPRVSFVLSDPFLPGKSVRITCESLGLSGTMLCCLTSKRSS